jgi:acrylyl-CoA reductase (NADPH)
MTRFTAFRLYEGTERPDGRLVDMTVDELPPGEVTIRVAYSSINYKDALAAAGINRIVRTFPRIGGIDFTGTVANSRDERFREGDEVIVHGFGIGVDHDGGHAQYARVPATG